MRGHVEFVAPMPQLRGKMGMKSAYSLGTNRRISLDSAGRFVPAFPKVVFLNKMAHAHLKTVSTLVDRHQIIMQFTAAPTLDDLTSIATAHLETLPEELLEKCNDLTVQIDEFPDTATEQDMGTNDPYDLLALFRPSSQISPGVTKKVAQGDDVLVLYRRPILDMWCEGGEDLNHLVRQIMIGELGDCLEFSESEIDEMINRHYQGLL